ncbi:MAG: TonB-dependent receptor [Bacteroidales bacterium]|nr:TonB-dependent receptor [Bacteroidales bacterium]
MIALRDSSGKGIPGVAVLLFSSHEKFISDQNGNLVLYLKPGVFEILFEHEDYLPMIAHVTIPTNDTIFFFLKSRVKTLPPVVIQDERVPRIDHKQVIVHKGIQWKNTRDDLASSLAREAGISSARIGSENSRIVIRGLGLDRVKVQEREFTYTGHYWGLDHELEVDAIMFQKTILHRGVGAILRGGGASFELIEILPSLNITHSSFNVTYYTSFLSSNLAFKQGIQIAQKKKNFFIQGSGSFLRYASLRVPADSFYYLGYRFPLEDRILKNTSGTRSIIRLDATYYRNKHIFFYVFEHYRNRMGFFAYAHGLPSVNIDEQADPPRYKFNLPYHDVFLVKTYFKYVVTLPNKWNFQSLAGYQFNRRTEFSYPHTHGLPLSGLTNNREIGLLLRNIQFQLGVENYSEKFNFKSRLISEYTTHHRDGYFYILPDYRLFHNGWSISTSVIRSQRLTIDLASRIDYHHFSTGSLLNPWIKDSAFQIFFTDLLRNYITFNAGGSVYLSPRHDEDTLIFFLGAGQRVPSPHEITMNGLHHNAFRHEMGNPFLKPELSFLWEMIYKKNFAEWKFKTNPYIVYYFDYIYLSPSGIFSPLPEGGQLYVYRSTRAIKPGFESQVTKSWFKFLTMRFTFDASYPYNLEDHYPLPFSPPMKFLSEWDFKIKSRLLCGLDVIHQFAQKWVDRNEKSTPGWTTFHLRFHYEKMLKNAGVIQFMLLLANLTNKTYYDHLSYYRTLNIPEPGRELRIQLIYSLKP